MRPLVRSIKCDTISIPKVEEVIDVGETVINRVERAIDTRVGYAIVTNTYIVEISYSVLKQVDSSLKYVRSIEALFSTSVVSWRSEVTSIQIACKRENV